MQQTTDALPHVQKQRLRGFQALVQLRAAGKSERQYLYFCTSKASKLFVLFFLVKQASLKKQRLRC
jgi:hypothetical protein